MFLRVRSHRNSHRGHPMKHTLTHVTTSAGTSRNVFLFAFLFLILAIAACTQLAQEPTPTVVPTPAPTSTPAPSLEDVAGLACQGKAVSGAASFTGDPDATYSIFVANMDGSSSPWNVNLPQALRAQEVADLNTVLCVDAQAPDPESTWECGNYKAATGESISLKVGRYLLNTRLVSASTGETIFDYQVLGR